MNPLLTTKQETFRAGTDKLEFKSGKTRRAA